MFMIDLFLSFLLSFCFFSNDLVEYLSLIGEERYQRKQTREGGAE